MLRRIALSVFLALSLTLGWVTVVLASWPTTADGPLCTWDYFYDTHLELHWHNNPNMNSYYQNAWTVSVNAWYHTDTPIYLYQVSSGGEISTNLYNDPNPNSNLGYTDLHNCFPYLQHLWAADAYMNTYYTHQTSWSDHEVQQLASHELGHALGLPHIANSFTEYAVMRQSIIRGDEYWTPRYWDIKLANCEYPNHRGC